MTAPIELTSDQTDLTIVHHALETARRLMPHPARWAIRAAGLGPWNEIYGLDSVDSMAIRMPGGALRCEPACSLDSLRLMMAGSPEDAWLGHLYSAFSQAAAGYYNLWQAKLDFVMLMRPRSIALAWRLEEGPFTGRYVASPLATGHEILGDLDDLERNFSRLFQVAS